MKKRIIIVCYSSNVGNNVFHLLVAIFICKVKKAIQHDYLTKDTIVVGKKRTVKLLNAKSKVKWKIVKGKKLISIKKSGKYNNKLVIKAKKSGKAQVCAYYKSKTFKTYLTIKNKKLSVQNNSKPDKVQGNYNSKK